MYLGSTFSTQLLYNAMAPLRFRISASFLSSDEELALLVWLFELPPSGITFYKDIVSVECTNQTKLIYNLCTPTRAYRFSAPEVVKTRFGIVLRQEKPYTTDLKGYNMLRKVSGDYQLAGIWNPFKHGWDFDFGLGVDETGVTTPLSIAEMKFQRNRNGLGYINGRRYRHKDLPINFVAASIKY